MSNQTETVLASLPLLIANGSFKALSHISETELEAFLSYLLNFLCLRDKQPIFKRPKWWANEVPFIPTFALGAPLPYAKDKLMHMKRMVRHVYGTRKSLDLLRMSQELSVLHSARLKCVHDESADTMTVFKDGIPLVIIPAQNFYHDLRAGFMKRSSSLSSEVSIFKVKQTASEIVDLVSDDEDTVVIEDSDDDCVFVSEMKLPSSPVKEKYLLPRRKIESPKRPPTKTKSKLIDIITLSSDEEQERVQRRRKRGKKIIPPEEKELDLHEFIKKENELNQKLKEEEEQINNQGVESFLQGFQLHKAVPEEPKAVEKPSKSILNGFKNGKRWKKCIPDITSVPELVRRQYLSKRYLASKAFLESHSDKIDELTRTDGILSLIRPFSVSVNKLSEEEVKALLNKHPQQSHSSTHI